MKLLCSLFILCSAAAGLLHAGEANVNLSAGMPDTGTGAVVSSERLNLDLLPDHFDREGYPESRDGMLVVKNSKDGPVVPLKNDPYGALLYAQFVTRQRDAVILSREGDFDDPLPDGTSFKVPYGFGAVKLNSAWTSLVEGMLIPHVSDDRKTYEVFPLHDLSLGATAGITGLSMLLRYTWTERYTVHFSLGSQSFGRYFLDGPFGYYKVPVHIGAGYRFPGLFEQFLGKNDMSIGLDFFAGFGDRDGSRDTPSFFWLPGVFFDFEKFFFSQYSEETGYRDGVKPYNYHVNSLFLRVGLYVNTVNPFDAGALLFDVSGGFLLGLRGPSIPKHDFKETVPVYMSDAYIERIEREKAARDKRTGSRPAQ